MKQGDIERILKRNRKLHSSHISTEELDCLNATEIFCLIEIEKPKKLAYQFISPDLGKRFIEIKEQIEMLRKELEATIELDQAYRRKESAKKPQNKEEDV